MCSYFFLNKTNFPQEQEVLFLLNLNQNSFQDYGCCYSSS